MIPGANVAFIHRLHHFGPAFAGTGLGPDGTRMQSVGSRAVGWGQ